MSAWNFHFFFSLSVSILKIHRLHVFASIMTESVQVEFFNQYTAESVIMFTISGRIVDCRQRKHRTSKSIGGHSNVQHSVCRPLNEAVLRWFESRWYKGVFMYVIGYIINDNIHVIFVSCFTNSRISASVPKRKSILRGRNRPVTVVS